MSNLQKPVAPLGQAAKVEPRPLGAPLGQAATPTPTPLGQAAAPTPAPIASTPGPTSAPEAQSGSAKLSAEASTTSSTASATVHAVPAQGLVVPTLEAAPLQIGPQNAQPAAPQPEEPPAETAVVVLYQPETGLTATQRAAAGQPRDALLTVIFGLPGIGKTVDTALTYPGGLFFATPGALFSVEATFGYMPSYVYVETVAHATQYMAQYAGKFTAFIFDDFSELVARTVQRIEESGARGFDIWRLLRAQVLEARTIARTLGVDTVFNCLGRETEFITKDGVKSFADFQDGDSVCVLTHKGTWEQAVVRSYGEQPLHRITVRRGPAQHEIRATAGHRWIERDGEIALTSELKPKTQLWSAPQVFSQTLLELAAYNGSGSAPDYMRVLNEVLRGLSTGLWARQPELDMQESYGRAQFVDVRTLPASLAAFVKAAYPEATTDSMVALVDHAPVDLSGNEPRHAFFVVGLVAGLAVDPEPEAVNPFPTLRCFVPEVRQYVERWAPTVGAFIVSALSIQRAVGSRAIASKSPRQREGKREGVQLRMLCGQSSAPQGAFSVSSVTDASPAETVWCLEVENTRSFMLPFGLATGNCMEANAKMSPTRGHQRGGPKLPSDFTEELPSLADMVLHAKVDERRFPHPACYSAVLSGKSVMKDRLNVVARLGSAPLNLAEIIRARGWTVHRHPVMVQYESDIENIASDLVLLPSSRDLMAKVNKLYSEMIGSGVQVPVARMALRDAVDRAEIRKGLQQADRTFARASSALN